MWRDVNGADSLCSPAVGSGDAGTAASDHLYLLICRREGFNFIRGQQDSEVVSLFSFRCSTEIRKTNLTEGYNLVY